MNKRSLTAFSNANEVAYYATDNYILCFFASTIMVDVLSIGDMAYGSMWYAMRSKEQFIVQIIIQRS